MQIPFRKPGKYAEQKNDNLLTEAKLQELKSKLHHLKTVSRPPAMVEVARLAETGDFSENAGYQAAKGRLRGINEKILRLERQVSDAVVIRPSRNGLVEIGSRVTVYDGQHDKKYTILGSSETNPATGIISHTSPIGAALIGKSVGDSVIVILANSEKILTIKSIV
jgi:transcription elongation factor GreA